MKHKRLLAACILLIAALPATAQKKSVLTGFSGGMMLHTGYVATSTLPTGYNAQGFVYGIGGALRLHFGDHFRLGSEGYVSELPTRSNGSYIKTGWGGILADVAFRKGRFMPYTGITIGGGALKTLLVDEGSRHDWQTETKALYRTATFAAVAPFVGCDYIISEAFHLSMKIDCLCGFGKNLHFPFGPRLYIGAIFYH